MQITVNNRNHLPLWPIGFLSVAIFLVLTFYNAAQHGWLGHWLLGSLAIVVIAIMVIAAMLICATYIDHINELDDD